MEMQMMVDYIRQSCMLDDPEGIEDSKYLALEDEDIQTVILISKSRLRASYSPLIEGEDQLFAIVLLAKKEIFNRLALKYANDTDLKGEAGTLYKSQKFKHYNSLVNQLEKDWRNFILEQESNTDVSNTSGYQTFNSGEVFLSGNYHSLRNKRCATKPQIELKVDKVYDTYVELSWRLKKVNRFALYNIYINNNTNIIDNYTNEVRGKKVFTTSDIHRYMARIKDLEPNTIYHLAIIVEEENGLTGHDELTFVTKGVE